MRSFFHFLIFFEFFMLILKLVKPKFDQHLNKFKTWKWKTKLGSFLVTQKWSFGEFLENFMLQIQNHFSSTLDFIVWILRYHTWYMHFSFWIYVDLVYQLELLVYDIVRPCAQVFHFFLCFLNFLCLFGNRSNLSVTNI